MVSFISVFLNNMSSFCVYIPRVNRVHTEESISYVFARYGYGFVERVDFVPIHKRPGFGSNVHNIVTSAFVHFQTDWYSPLLDRITKGLPYKMQVAPREYWVCLPRRQSSQRVQYLEQILEDKIRKVSKLEKTLEQLIVTRQTYSLFPTPDAILRDLSSK